MKLAHCVIFLLIYTCAASQSTYLPLFLEGTWKVEEKDNFEHWDVLSNNSMKGISYSITNGNTKINEYLQIEAKKKKVLYTADVINQNNGKGIKFNLIHSDTAYIFENLKHDFPKRISYKKLSENTVSVEVSDGKDKGYSYKMIRQSQIAGLKAVNNAELTYDKELAQQYGADDYGMKSYFLVILKSGNNTTDDTSFISQCFRGHMDNIARMVKEKKLVIAGPIGKNHKNYRGIFILYNVKSVEEAESILLTDPAIKANLLGYDIYNWYGSAALEAYLPLSDKVTKIKP